MIEDPVIFPHGIVPAFADCSNDRFDGILYLDDIRTLDHTRRFQPKPSGGVGLSCIRFFLSKEER
jgi:hypothetical protein